MAIIVIKDLPESVDLDRRAMAAITGGMRARGHQTALGRRLFRSVGVASHGTAFGRDWLVDVDRRAAVRISLK
jgi:hypothetical protein